MKYKVTLPDGGVEEGDGGMREEKTTDRMHVLMTIDCNFLLFSLSFICFRSVANIKHTFVAILMRTHIKTVHSFPNLTSPDSILKGTAHHRYGRKLDSRYLQN